MDGRLYSEFLFSSSHYHFSFFFLCPAIADGYRWSLNHFKLYKFFTNLLNNNLEANNWSQWILESFSLSNRSFIYYLRRSSCMNYHLHKYDIYVPYFYSSRARFWYFACFLLSIGVCLWFAHSTMTTIWHILFSYL